ncbi:hypothetical protein C0585_07300 [Candidatus Woesearchaeota archaeon]|nr:MAG: hypothetical protein C0585_07300 [Candidatus Woesearchaeota archaeon]
MRLTRSKKGVSIYLGWVLLMAFMVSLSTLVYFWMSTHVEEQAEKIVERSDENLCEFTSLSINGFCQDEIFLHLNITNSNDKRIESLKFQLFDLYDEPMENELTISLKSSGSESIKILKHGTLSQAEIIPLIEKDQREILCESSKLILNDIDFC